MGWQQVRYSLVTEQQQSDVQAEKGRKKEKENEKRKEGGKETFLICLS